MRLDAYDAARVQDAVATLDRRGAALMRMEAIAPADVTVLYFADVCYVAQAYTLEVPIDPGAADGTAIYRAFLAAHQRIYGYAAEVPARIVNLRAVHVAHGADALPAAALPAAGKDAVKGHRRIVTAEAPDGVQATVLDRAAMPPGFRLAGPAIVEQDDTTTLVEPGWSGIVDDAGNLVLARS